MCDYLSNIPCACEKNPIDLHTVFGNINDGTSTGAVERVWKAFIQGQFKELMEQVSAYAASVEPDDLSVSEQRFALHINDTLETVLSILKSAYALLTEAGEVPPGFERRIHLNRCGAEDRQKYLKATNVRCHAI